MELLMLWQLSVSEVAVSGSVDTQGRTLISQDKKNMDEGKTSLKFHSSFLILVVGFF